MRTCVSVLGGFIFVIAICIMPFWVTSPYGYFPISTPRQSYVFVFGDSYTTTGYNPNNHDLQPSIENPLGNVPNPGIITGGDGLTNWVGKLALDHLPERWMTYAYNYAMGAAVINFNRYDFLKPAKDFFHQAKDFLEADTRPKFETDQAAAVVWFGTNDLFAHTMVPATANDDFAIIQTQQDYWADVGYLYDAGIRYFVILLAHPLERVPKVVLDSDTAYQKLLGDNRVKWNEQLVEGAKAFVASHPEAKLATVDLPQIFNEVLDNPTKYGSPDNTCVNNDGITCVWHDMIHPGQAIHTGIADNVAAAFVELGFYPPPKAPKTSKVPETPSIS